MSPPRGPMPSRHWKKTDLTWASFLSSTESCETCRVLVAGCRGCFYQHAIDEAKDILCCNIDFSYPTQREWTKMEEDTSYLPRRQPSGTTLQMAFYYLSCSIRSRRRFYSHGGLVSRPSGSTRYAFFKTTEAIGEWNLPRWLRSTVMAT
jgi:hypothetical protein